MLANDLTGQLARERVADLHHQAQRQHLVRVARGRRRRGHGGVWRGPRLLAGWLRGPGEGATKPSTAMNGSSADDAVTSS